MIFVYVYMMGLSLVAIISSCIGQDDVCLMEFPSSHSLQKEPFIFMLNISLGSVVMWQEQVLRAAVSLPGH